MLALLLSAIVQLPATERVPLPDAADAALERGDRRGAHEIARAALDACGAEERCLDLLIMTANLARGTLPDAEAEAIARRAAEQAERLSGESVDTASALNNVAMLLTGERFAEAEPLYRRALRIAETQGAAQVARMIASNLATTLEDHSRHADAEPLRRKAIELSSREANLSVATRIGLTRALAINLLRQSRYVEGEQVLRPITEAADVSAADLDLLLRLLNNQGRVDEALPVARRVVAMRTESLGAADARTLTALSGLATVLTAAGQFGEAERLYRQILNGRKQASASDGEMAILQTNLAFVLDKLGRHRDAEPLHRAAARAGAESFGEEDEFTATMYAGLANNLAAQGKNAEAEPFFRQALNARRRIGIETRTDWIDGHADLGRFLVGSGRGPAEGRSLLRTAQRGIEARLASFTDFNRPAQTELGNWSRVYVGQVAAAWALAKARD